MKASTNELDKDRFHSVSFAIFGIALAVRLVHVWQIRRAPFFTLLLGDSRSYDEWAQRIAGGEWIGRDVFYQAPLYPYFLGVVYTAAGRSLLIARVVQALVGSASCVLLAGAAWRLFSSKTAGVVAGMMLALYAPAIFFDGLLQKSVLDVFFVCLALRVIAGITGRLAANTAFVGPRARRVRPKEVPPRRVWLHQDLTLWFALGLAIGGLSLTRENALVFIVAIVIWAFVMARVKSAVLFLAGVAVVLVPVAARNSYVGGGFYVTTSQFGPNLYIGNHTGADGTYASLRYGRGAPEYERQDATELAEHALGRPLTPSDVSEYWTDKAMDFIESHPDAWLKLLARKSALLLNATEVVDTESQDTHAEWSWPLRVLGPVMHFGVLVPLAVFGVFVTWPLRSRLMVLYALMVAYAASVVLFYVFARYRYPLVPFLVCFAAAGLVEAEPFLRQRRVRWTCAAAVIAAAVFSNWPMFPAGLMQAVTESNLGVGLQEAHRLDEATAHFRRSVALRPDYAPAYSNLASVLRLQGKVAESVAAFRRALELQPDFPDAQYNLGNALLDEGQTDEAIGQFQTALKSIPASVDVHNNLGTALATKGRPNEAMAEFREALRLDPNSSIAHRNLGDLLDSAGDRAGALEHLRKAVEIAPSDGELHYDLGNVLLETGALDNAVAEFTIATERMPQSAEARNNLGIAYGSLGRLDDAIDQFRRALAIKPGFADAQRNLAMAQAARRLARPRKTKSP
jgi:tetratricopeptide (TPR) repeat protein